MSGSLASTLNTKASWVAPHINLLLVWGGGAGGGYCWGGGWAWEYYANSSYSITAGAKTVTIGAGWTAWRLNTLVVPWNWWSSVFDTKTVAWWGCGSVGWGSTAYYAATGWSGWGGWSTASWTAWASWTASGWWDVKAWGNSSGASGNYTSWWGGGAGAAWSNTANSSSVANGWVGIQNSISWTATYYAGGGGWGSYNHASGWGTGWSGGGGNGWKSDVAWSTAAQDWTANTGGGGGWGSGSADTEFWKVGWSWICIVAYKTDWTDWVSTSSTGGTVTTSWGYTIHTFTSSGTFTCVLS